MFSKSERSDGSKRCSQNNDADNDAETFETVSTDLELPRALQGSKRSSIAEMRAKVEPQAARSMSATARAYMYTPKEQISFEEPRKDFSLVSKSV